MITLHTNHGDIKLELFADKAPISAANFEQYCRDGHYDGTLFHRVIDRITSYNVCYTKLLRLCQP